MPRFPQQRTPCAEKNREVFGASSPYLPSRTRSLLNGLKIPHGLAAKCGPFDNEREESPSSKVVWIRVRSLIELRASSGTTPPSARRMGAGAASYGGQHAQLACRPVPGLYRRELAGVARSSN